MALFQRKPRSGQRFIIIFDIGSGSIGGSFVSVETGKLPEIIFATRKDIPFQERLNFQRFLDLMIKTLEEMFVAMQKAGQGVRVERAFCILASPWYASQTRKLRYSQPAPFVVTQKVLDKLIEKETDLFRSSKLFARSKVGATPPEIMEVKNIQIKLNGYEVRNPFKKHTSLVEIALYISMIPSNIKKSIDNSIVKFWHVPRVSFSSFSFTAFDVIRDIFVDEKSFLFMDVSGEVTDISLVKDGVLEESISFPAGRNMLLRAIINALKTTPDGAVSELLLATQGDSHREHADAIRGVLENAKKEWLSFFDASLAQLSAEFPIPRTIFYTADDDVTLHFDEALRAANFPGASADDTALSVRALSNAFLSKFVQVLEPSFQDPFLTIETIHANKFIQLSSTR